MSAILWDMDDTLLNTLPGRMLSLAHAHEQCLGSKTDPLALWRSHRGGSLEAMGKRLLGERDYMRFVDCYRDFYYKLDRNIEPYAGIIEVLDEVRAAQIPMAVVTSKVSYGAIEELTSTGLLQYFQAVVGADDTDLHKPDPSPVYEALDRILIEPTRDVVFVGDSPADIWAAKNAGVTSIAALWGTIDAELLTDAYPDHTAANPVELIELFAVARSRR